MASIACSTGLAPKSLATSSQPKHARSSMRARSLASKTSQKTRTRAKEIANSSLQAKLKEVSPSWQAIGSSQLAALLSLGAWELFPSPAAAATLLYSLAEDAADVAAGAADVAAEAADAVAGAADVAAEVVEKAAEAVEKVAEAPEGLGNVLLLIPLVAYGIFYVFREKVNPKAGLLDFLFWLTFVVIFANLLTSVFLKIRLY